MGQRTGLIHISASHFSSKALPQKYGNSQLARIQLLASPISPTPPPHQTDFNHLNLLYSWCLLAYSTFVVYIFLQQVANEQTEQNIPKYKYYQPMAQPTEAEEV